MARKKRPISSYPRKVFRVGPALNVVGEALRTVRAAADLTQDELATKCQRQGWDIDRMIVTKIETGRRRVSDAEVKLLADILNVSADVLLGRAGR